MDLQALWKLLSNLTVKLDQNVLIVITHTLQLADSVREEYADEVHALLNKYFDGARSKVAHQSLTLLEETSFMPILQIGPN